MNVKRYIRFALYLVMVTMVVPGLAFGGQFLQKKGFAVSLPDGWKEIPRDIIDKYEREIFLQAPKAEKQRYDYGFQLKRAKNWFEYPYILIQNKNTGRIPQAQLERLVTLSEKGGFAKDRKALRSIMSDIRRGRMSYDKKERIVWMRLEMRVIDIGKVVGLSGIIPTEKGIIQVSGYALKSAFLKYEPSFRQVTRSVVPDEVLAYQPERQKRRAVPGLRMDWRKWVMNILALTMISGITGVLAVYMLKRKRRA